MKKLFLLLMTVFAIGMCASAQTRTVRGIVLDVDNDEPLPGVSVSAGSNTGLGVVSDAEGVFAIQLPAKASKLTFSMVGYKTVEMIVPAQGEMIVKMTSATTELNEVIAVAYGTIKKSEYTGSAGVVKADQLANTQVSNVTNALSAISRQSLPPTSRP